jgi:DMSO/TMAO reductase YedYZ molybdopterin-dependent catalytic subunit
MSLRLQESEPLSLVPEVRPTPLRTLALEDLPTRLHFVRSHFRVPDADESSWAVEVGGAVRHPTTWSVAQLKERTARTATVVLECAGHRRNEFSPPANGLQWGPGAVSEARWTGVPLAHLLADVRPTKRAVEVVFEGADRGPHRSAEADVPFARSIPLERACCDDILVAWEMNGRPLPARHGAPLRLIVPGSYGVASVKWLQRITVVERPFDGPFQAIDYQLAGEPLAELRVSSLIITPEAGAVSAGTFEVAGVAWGDVAKVEARLAGGGWQPAALETATGPNAFTRWSTMLSIPPGAHILEARATDKAGRAQPPDPAWNELGYANNSIHRVHVTAADD